MSTSDLVVHNSAVLGKNRFSSFLLHFAGLNSIYSYYTASWVLAWYYDFQTYKKKEYFSNRLYFLKILKHGHYFYNVNYIFWRYQWNVRNSLFHLSYYIFKYFNYNKYDDQNNKKIQNTKWRPCKSPSCVLVSDTNLKCSTGFLQSPYLSISCVANSNLSHCSAESLFISNLPNSSSTSVSFNPPKILL